VFFVKKTSPPSWKCHIAAASALVFGAAALGDQISTNSPADPAAPVTGGPAAALETPAAAGFQNWNWHAQNTDIVQGYPAFPAQYTGVNSLPSGGQTRETVSLDLMAGVRLWRGAEAHVDGLMWQGFGLHGGAGADGFPNGEGSRLGTDLPNENFSRLFLRQTIGFGGEQEDVADDALDLAGREDVSRLTITAGRFSAKDIFDNNSYANDPRTQFMNWALEANEAWDYPADALGYTSGLALELNQPQWTFRYGFFQVPQTANNTYIDYHFLEAWGMVTELERRFTIGGHPGAVRLLGYFNRAHMGSYQEAVNNFNQGGSIDITQTRSYRSKYGFGLNAEQEIATNVGVFTRLGWSDGQNEAWMFSDVDYSASLGVSVKGAAWHRPDDTFGLAGAMNGLSHSHQEFFEDGGVGILAGDGNLNYSPEKVLETYYDLDVWKTVHVAVDYQFVADPAFNQDRGPVSVFSARLHWEF
jgi:high affinity Mn2+ porin